MFGKKTKKEKRYNRYKVGDEFDSKAGTIKITGSCYKRVCQTADNPKGNRIRVLELESVHKNGETARKSQVDEITVFYFLGGREPTRRAEGKAKKSAQKPAKKSSKKK